MCDIHVSLSSEVPSARSTGWAFIVLVALAAAACLNASLFDQDLCSSCE